MACPVRLDRQARGRQRYPVKGEFTMEQDPRVHQRELSVQWIKAASGSTYLCPVTALKRLDNPREDQLKLICVYESANPQNE